MPARTPVVPGRFDAARLEGLATSHGGIVETIDGIRVRLIKGVRNDSGRGRQYIPTSTVSDSQHLRDKVVAELETRVKRDAAELKIWGYTRAERNRLFSELDEIWGIG